MKQQTRIPTVALLALALPTLCASARAGVLEFNIAFNTTALASPPGSLAMPFQFAAVLTDGGNGPSTTVTLDQFDLGGGIPGNLGSGIDLTDTDFFNFVNEPFTPGSRLGFRLRSTFSVTASSVPDELDLLILAGGLTNSTCGAIPTNDPRGVCALLRVTFDSEANPLVEIFGGTGDFATVRVEGAPEPFGFALAAPALAVLAALRMRQRRRRLPCTMSD